MLPTITRRNSSPFFWKSILDDDIFPSFNVPGNNNLPAVNIREEEKNYFVDLAVPGLSKDDIKIDVKDDLLTISSEQKNENQSNGEGFTRREFSYSSFCRSFHLPEGTDAARIEASYKDGILSVTIPREEKKAELSRQIKIK